MAERPYVILSCAMSLDGHIDDTSQTRLLLSNEADFERVDALRASADAILVGANTVRRDNPSLAVKSAALRRERAERGQRPHPLKVTLTSGTSSTIDGKRKVFDSGETVVYCPDAAVDSLKKGLHGKATVVGLGEQVDLAALLADLAGRGVQRLVVEGGAGVHTEFLTHGLVDELQLAIAPFFVGAADAPRFVNPGVFPQDAAHRMTITEAFNVGDMVFVRYLAAEQGQP
ncbi:MAG TPA: dihydrofolate reductase family protein [Pseudonocardiaceae bacterium]|nr:dihydrofolate reductase family protein [Pseudonocardiaceae bacterium]